MDLPEMTHERAHALELLRDWHHNQTVANQSALYNAATKLFGNPPAIEIVSSPRPVLREHLIRDFKSEIDDLETVVRHLKYVLSEL